MTTLVTGATGWVGARLVASLPKATVLSRDPAGARAKLGVTAALGWASPCELPPAEVFDGVDVVVHLAGEPVTNRTFTAGTCAVGWP